MGTAGIMTACSGEVSKESDAIALVGATVIDGTGADAIKNALIIVEGDRITCAGDKESCLIPEGAIIIDLTGKYVTPGLVDSHIHFGQTGWLDGRPDGVNVGGRYPYEDVVADLRDHPETRYRSYLCSGVTAVYDVGGFPWTIGLKEGAENNTAAPHIAAAGPLVSHAGRLIMSAGGESTFIMLTSEDVGIEAVRQIKSWGADAVKVWFLAPSEEDRAEIDARFMAVAKEAKAQGINLIVHATTYREAKIAVDAGAHMLVHSVTNQPVDDDFITAMKASGTFYAPTLFAGANWGMAIAAAGLQFVPIIDDPNGCVDPATREKLLSAPEQNEYVLFETSQEIFQAGLARNEVALQLMNENLKRVHDEGIPVVMATDAGNPMTLHGVSVYAEMEGMQAAGLTPREVIVAATQTGARVMGREKDFGTLEAGKIADLIVLSENPLEDVSTFRSIMQVMRAGKMHDIADLSWNSLDVPD